MNDPFNLDRFLTAQESTYPTALNELRAGKKRTHWMWFIFPQMIGLGYSAMAQHYAIRSRAEATAYLSHEVLGNRLRECAEVVMQLNGLSVSEIFGHPDDLKFHSSITLFAEVGEEGSLFSRLLLKYFSGKMDERTITILKRK